MDANNMDRDKTNQELHKNAMSYSEHFLEATLHKIAAVQPLTSHL